ncbi:YbaB/EbfC family nucleoid-associated protein [Nonomuraea sp. NPDC049695]|uniref:YbaB/EbfC family nucleoid-associated protein n=1 Tax=Nonomuraea sp. NPDC049695 TaxID=3154734 RepID=UPI00341D9B21
MFDFDPAAVTPEQLEKLARRSDEAMSRLAAAMNGLDEVIGQGLAADGKVRATVEADGLLRDVRFDPRVLRTMGSDELSEAIVEAVRSAQLSARGQLEERVAAAQGGERLSLDIHETHRRLEAIQSAFLSSLDSR